MRKKLLGFIAFAALLTAGCSGTGSNKGTDSGLTPLEAEEAAEGFIVTDGQLLSKNGFPVVVDFSAEWCPPCRKFKPIFEQLKEEYAGSVDFITINVDSVPELAGKYQIESIPTIMYISRDGSILHRAVGYQEPDSVRAAVARYL